MTRTRPIWRILRDAANLYNREGVHPIAAVYQVTKNDVSAYLQTAEALDIATQDLHGKDFETFARSASPLEVSQMFTDAIKLNQTLGREVSR